ncbi:hypothetical protein J1N35_043055 [Gossypium stocksii]|uniref:Uncharacterized protein n=1 Tax=Gossypium stocksii TaxID=47602 RepID=A0A9D3U6N2_9ROSI|nr:hypothetical protein J1N35_043055 [Gossypium stocksii]
MSYEGCGKQQNFVLEKHSIGWVKLNKDDRVDGKSVESDNKMVADSLLGTRKVGTRKVVLKICNWMKKSWQVQIRILNMCQGRRTWRQMQYLNKLRITQSEFTSK